MLKGGIVVQATNVNNVKMMKRKLWIMLRILKITDMDTVYNWRNAIIHIVCSLVRERLFNIYVKTAYVSDE